jgi:hypothetical protein
MKKLKKITKLTMDEDGGGWTSSERSESVMIVLSV